MSKYCNECGLEILDGDNFCGECGAEIMTEESGYNSTYYDILPKVGGSILLCVGGLGFFFGILLMVHGFFSETWIWYIESLEFFEFKSIDSNIFILWGLIMTVTSLLPVIGGLNALDHRNWRQVIVTGIAGLFLIGPFFMLTIFSAIGLFIVALAKSEFDN